MDSYLVNQGGCVPPCLGQVRSGQVGSGRGTLGLGQVWVRPDRVESSCVGLGQVYVRRG